MANTLKPHTVSDVEHILNCTRSPNNSHSFYFEPLSSSETTDRSGNKHTHSNGRYVCGQCLQEVSSNEVSILNMLNFNQMYRPEVKEEINTEQGE